VRVRGRETLKGRKDGGKAKKKRKTVGIPHQRTRFGRKQKRVGGTKGISSCVRKRYEKGGGMGGLGNQSSTQTKSERG